jgi:hypothetical protein
VFTVRVMVNGNIYIYIRVRFRVKVMARGLVLGHFLDKVYYKGYC